MTNLFQLFARITVEQFVENEKLENQKFCSSLQFFLKHSFRDLKRRKFHYCLALCSVFIVVIFSLIINTIVSKGPIVFLKLSEGTRGEIDGVVTSSYVGSIDIGASDFNTWGTYLNFSKFEEINQPQNKELYHQDLKLSLSPRKNFCGVQMGSDQTNRAISDTDDEESMRNWKAGYDNSTGLPSRAQVYNGKIDMEYQVCISLFDTKLEKDYEIGRQYKFEPLEYGECNVNKKAFSTLGVQEGDIVYFDLIISQFMNNLLVKFDKYASHNNKQRMYYKGQGSQVQNTNDITYVTYETRVFLPCKVKRLTSGTYGKFPDTNIANLQMMEYKHFLKLLSNYLPNDYDKNQDFKEFLRNEKLVNLKEYADVFLLQLPRPRVQHYEDSNYDVIQKRITVYASQASTQLGFYPIQIQLNILADMQTYSQAVMFLGLIFDVIILLFVILSILLIYSLLMISVETKTFEIGVMRMIGLSKVGLITLICLQSIMFVLPAIILGFAACFPILKGIYGFLLTDDLGIPNDPVPDGLAVLQALIIGIIIPILSSIYPIKVVLTKNLGDSLDYSRSKTQAIYITILRNDDYERIGKYVPLGMITTAYGIAIYYFLPLSLLSMNLGMILRIFFLILLAMLLGLTMLALNVQRMLEIVLTYLFLFYEKRSMRMLVLKNLTAHKLRNMMTSIIFSLALGFIIFLIVAYTLQIKTSQLIQLQRKGGYIVLTSGDDSVTHPNVVDPILQKYSDLVDSYAYITGSLASIDDAKISDIEISDKGKVNPNRMQIYGVTPSIYDATISDFLVKGTYNESTGLPFGEQLYTARGSQGIGMSSVIADLTDTNYPEENFRNTVLFSISSSVYNRFFQLRSIFDNKKSPAFIMTDRMQSEGYRHHGIVSMTSFVQYANFDSMKRITFDRVIIKLKDPLNMKNSDAFISGMRKTLTPYQDKTLNVYNYNDGVENVQRMETILNMIFNVIIAITMFLCFFSLSSSMTANLFEQSKEIGIMRAMGLTKVRIILLYIYEAFVLVMASSLLGILIGTLVGFSMTMQQMLFVEIPLQFFFPWMQFLLVIGLSILCAILSTVGPTRNLVKKSISGIFRVN
ncbi:family protein [Stylonychia lemnae]|uniref:Family protein n=1 Tax=Stylonychia lemnae TaxID=5949 RepID=A0A078AAD8_STYLE|nr:family protein [Stylonychia lemnae]|eukprot:CDW77763.1 family protein [Stylonychia lemnae]